MNEEELELEFKKISEIINDDFICIEPKVVPFMPGDDPSIIDIQSEFKYDNF